MSLLTYVTLAQQNTEVISFHVGQTQLSEKQKVQLQKATSSLKEEDRLLISVLTYNYVKRKHVSSFLAPRQAEEIAKYLKGLGFYSKIHKQAAADSAKGGAPVVTVVASHLNMQTLTDSDTETEPEESSISEPEEKQYIALKDKFGEKPSQFFTINPLKDTMLMADEGTVLYVPAGSLMSEDSVVLELKEYYQLGDFLKEDLMTVSNDELIETGGTIYLNAETSKLGSEPVFINPKMGIDVEFSNQKEGMEVFLPEPNVSPINWLTTDQIVSEGTFYAMEIQYDYLGDTLAKKIFDSEEELKAYQNWKIDEAERLKLQKEAELKRREKRESTLQTIYNLGYINCDRFIEESFQPLVLDAPADAQVECFLVFQDVGVMRGNRLDGKIEFSKVPMNKTATLVAVSFTNEESWYYSSRFTIGSGAPKINLEQKDDDFIQQQIRLF